MAGSLNHIVDPDGSFNPVRIETVGDAWEALEECFDIIAELTGGDLEKLNSICKKLRYPSVKAAPIRGARNGQWSTTVGGAWQRR